MCFSIFLVLDPYRLVIWFIALIHIVCCLTITSNHANGFGFHSEDVSRQM